MLDEEESEFIHLGIKRRSGRYPWGSGNDPYQRSQSMKSFVEDLTSKGLTPTEIAKTIEAFGKKSDPHARFSTTDLRAAIAISTEEIHRENVATAVKLKATQMSNIAIANEMGTRESTVRGWLKASEERSVSVLRATANTLKEMVEHKPFLDVGKGTNLSMGVAPTKFNTALAMLRDEGYNVHPIKIRQLGSDKMTNYRVLTKEDVTWSQAREAVVAGNLKIVTSQSDDGGLSYRVPKDLPVSVSSKRIDVAFKEDGGLAKDGIIELRRGVPDLDLGASRYAQVRVSVDGTHYLKGMAIYADDLPAGIDIRFNTNKSKTVPGGKLGAMKPLKVVKKTGEVDPDNPFGARGSALPKVYLDKNGKEKTSPLNVINEEGNWDEWSKNLSSQMLSKQPLTLASTQLSKARTAKEKELDEILSLTNPVVRQKLLIEFADSADAAAVHLKAAHLNGQSTHVILPMNSMRPHEIYAPNFENGTKVVLVRHPHGGPFEIPELTVNNKNRTAQRIMSTNPKDAVGIHHTVAEQLSGADFDGDTVLVIPNDAGKVKTRPPLPGLANFDAKSQYSIADDDTTTLRMTKKTTQTEMGKISNLITDMTIHKASDDEIARAVRHSMVVIDAEKHGLDYKASEKDNNISQLKTKYQGGPTKGASTLISRASAEGRVDQIKLRPAAKGGPIDPKTGQLVWEPTGVTYPKTVTKTSKKTGETTTKTTIEPKVTKGSKMEFAKDARELLSSRTNPQPMEEVYAAHANAMKALANEARKAYVNTESPKQSAAAKAFYADEVKSLSAQLKLAQSNAPLERRAQAIGGALAKARIDDDPSLDKDDVKKIQYQARQEARDITGANKVKVSFSDREWAAVQSGAISSTMLRELLTHADTKRVKELATPRYRSSLTPGQLARAKSMAASGKPLSEIAASLGIPRSTISDNLKNA